MTGSSGFLCIPASDSGADAVNPNEIKTLLANGLIKFFINGKSAFSNGPRSLPRNPSGYAILDNWVFDILILVDDLLAKTLRRFPTSLLANNNLWGKLVAWPEFPIISDDTVKTKSVSFFIADFNLLNCEFNSFTFKLFYFVILYWWEINY